MLYVCVHMHVHLYVCVHVLLNLCCQCLYVTRICKRLGPVQVVRFQYLLLYTGAPGKFDSSTYCYYCFIPVPLAS